MCHKGQKYSFDRTRTQEQGWRITGNPMAWGSAMPEVLVLGFSKGPTQAGALSSQPHDEIAYRGGRTDLAKILHYVGLLPSADSSLVDRAIADRDGRFHFASLIRCTVERHDARRGQWTGTGGGMLDRFVATGFGATVAANCTSRFLSELPAKTRLVIMLGMGSKGSYIAACRNLFAAARPGPWSNINDVSYSDGRITVVHTEHFQSQGALIPNWLSGDRHERGRLGVLAREGVASALHSDSGRSSLPPQAAAR